MSEWQLEQLKREFHFGQMVSKFDRNGDFQMLSVDDDFCSMLGYTKSDLIVFCRNKTRLLIYEPDDQMYNSSVVRDLIERGWYSIKHRMRCRNGELLWVWNYGSLEKDIQGKQVIRSVIFDINESVRLKRNLDCMVQNVPGGVVRFLITETNFYVTWADDKYFDMMKIIPDIYLGTSGILVLPEDLPKMREYLIHRAEQKTPVDLEVRCRVGEEGQIRWFWIRGCYYDDAEDGCEYTCSVIDVTDRHMQQRELQREREARYISLRLKADFLFSYDETSGQLRAYSVADRGDYIPCIGTNESGEDKTGGRPFIHPDDAAALKEFITSDGQGNINIRFLSIHRKTEEVSYQQYQVETGNIPERSNLIIGSAMHIQQERKRESRRRQLRRIYEAQSNKIYELILSVEVRTGQIQGYFTGETPFEDVYGDCDFDEFVRITVEEKVHPDDREMFIQAFQLTNMIDILQHSESEEVITLRIRNTPDQEFRYKCFRYSYMGTRNDIIVVTSQDVHKLREEQMKTEDANRKILASALNEERVAKEMRRNFSVMLSAELKEPVEFVISELGRTGKMDSAGEDVKEALRYTLKVLDNLTKYEKIEQGKVRLENKQFSVDELFWDTLRGWKNYLQETGVELTFSMNFKWKYYFGDALILTEMINHIIGNCVVASGDKGYITVWGNDEDQGDGVSVLHLTIEDHGIPVNETFFGRMYPVDGKDQVSNWRREGRLENTKFSLVIARQEVELMGGNIVLSRSDDKTNSIEITIPLQRSLILNQADRPQLVQQQDQESDVDLSVYSILLIDPGIRNDNLRGPLLKLHGAHLDMAESGKEGMDLWLSYPANTFDVIILNNDLGDMDFLEFTEMFRSKIRYKVPILVMFDGVRPDTVRESMRSGVNAFISETFDLVRLKKIFEVLVDKD